MKGYVATSWGQVQYRSGGAPISRAGRTVVFLHESPRDSRVYTEVMNAFPEDVTTVALDTPGFGSSDDAPAGKTLPEYARVLLEALAQLRIDRAVIVGMKTGSYLGIHLMNEGGGSARFPGAVLYAMDAADEQSNEFWAENWAPPLDFSDGRALFDGLWQKNLAIYGDEAKRECAEATADAVSNADRYNSIYPAVFRGMSGTFAALRAIVAGGVAVTLLEPPVAKMTQSEGIMFARIESTNTIVMPVSGQFPRRATIQFVAIVSEVLATL